MRVYPQEQGWRRMLPSVMHSGPAASGGTAIEGRVGWDERVGPQAERRVHRHPSPCPSPRKHPLRRTHPACLRLAAGSRLSIQPASAIAAAPFAILILRISAPSLRPQKAGDTLQKLPNLGEQASNGRLRRRRMRIFRQHNPSRARRNACLVSQDPFRRSREAELGNQTAHPRPSERHVRPPTTRSLELV